MVCLHVGLIIEVVWDGIHEDGKACSLAHAGACMAFCFYDHSFLHGDKIPGGLATNQINTVHN